MVISKGEDWGEHVHEKGIVCTRHDREVFLNTASPIKGDIARTVGSVLQKRSEVAVLKSREEWHRLPLDIIQIDIRGHIFQAAAHIRVGHLLWGECYLFCNVAYFKGFRVFAKSHPNDAKVEVLTINREMKLRQRLLALMRARKGSHLPHPHLSSRQITDEYLRFHQSLPVFVDGKKRGTTDALRISVIADAINIYIPSDPK